jgi:Zn-dependent M28 family amino/carboxypeptidase
MKHFVLIALYIIFCPTLRAQKNIDAIRMQTIEAHLSFLASDALQGRQAGKQGGRVAAEYIQAVLKESGIKPFFNTYFQTFEAFSPARDLEMGFQVHPDSVIKYKQLPAYRRLSLQNVVGYIEGKRKNEYVVIGAHYDHLGIDELLVGDPIYNGADDNAAGVAALLQIAKVFAEKEEKPLRSILFACWDGEEVNYLGSEYFVANFDNTSELKANINLDMISREGLLPILYPDFKIPEPTEENTADSRQFHLVYTEELTKASEHLKHAIRAGKLTVEPKTSVMIHTSRGSDYLAFSQRGVPILWFFTGLHPDYHTPADEVHHIDADKLLNITKAIYLGLYYIANQE